MLWYYAPCFSQILTNPNLMNDSDNSEETSRLSRTYDAVQRAIDFPSHQYERTDSYDVGDSVDRMRAKERNNLPKILQNCYFGRIIYQENGMERSHYIGKIGFYKDPNTEIMDWRSPLASLFYEQVGEERIITLPGKLYGDLPIDHKITFQKKRQYDIDRKTLKAWWEETKEGTSSTSGAPSGDPLLDKLSAESKGRMSDIVATIQKEQSSIVRNETAKVLVVNGVAGSGKTSIVLHREAYLLYRDQNTLQANQILILSPNKGFGDYIANVLPSLGEDKINQETVEGLGLLLMPKGKKFLTTTDMEKLNGSAALLTSHEKWKMTLDFAVSLRDFVESNHSKYQHNTESAKDPWEIVLHMYNDFLSHHSQTMALITWEKLTWIDAFPLLFIASHLSIKDFDDISSGLNGTKHVLIDEMQDYTPIQYMFLHRVFRDFPRKQIVRNWCLLGDSNQALNPFIESGHNVWKTVFGSDVEEKFLEKSYRSTVGIMQFAHRYSKGPIEVFGRQGDKPESVCFQSENELIADLSTRICKWQSIHSNHRLAIITKTRQEASSVFDCLKEVFPCQILDDSSDQIPQTKIIVSCSMIAKGLEFDDVIIPFGLNRSTGYSEIDKRLLYVACTRAMHNLVLLSLQDNRMESVHDTKFRRCTKCMFFMPEELLKSHLSNCRIPVREQQGSNRPPIERPENVFSGVHDGIGNSLRTFKGNPNGLLNGSDSENNILDATVGTNVIPDSEGEFGSESLHDRFDDNSRPG